MPLPSRPLIHRWRIRLLVFLLPGLFAFSPFAANGAETIRLLSDEAADICVKDPDCMHRLFVHAAFGGEPAPDRSQPLIKWSGPIRIASIMGDQIDDDVQAAIGSSLQKMRHLAAIAGSDFNAVDGTKGQIVNFVLLASRDFAKDRDGAFSTLLSDVFAGRLDLYDELAAGKAPICQGELFVSPDASIAGGLALLQSDVDITALRRCLHRVTLNVLGFRHPLPEGVDSVLNPNSKRQAWTTIDFLLLRMLNDPAVTPGMALADLTAMFPKIHQRALHPSN